MLKPHWKCELTAAPVQAMNAAVKEAGEKIKGLCDGGKQDW
jgi:hypothetical protein